MEDRREEPGQIHDLVMDMLSFSKDREPAIEPTDLNELCDDVLELIRAARRNGASRSTGAGTGVGPCPCDPEGIHRAV